MNKSKTTSIDNEEEILLSDYELIALRSVILKDDAYTYRKICRYYSEKFSTPLMETYKLPWNHIVQNYIESIIEQTMVSNKESIYNAVIDLAYPEKKDQEEMLLQEQIKMFEEMEKKRRESKKEEPKKEETKEPEISMGENAFKHLEEDEENS